MDHIMKCHYQYARPNDKLPSVKRAFSRAKREMRGLHICRPDSDWLQRCQTTSLGQWEPEDPFQCQRWRELVLARFVVLQSWRFYFKMEEKLFSSKNSDLNNNLALCIDNNDNQMTFVGHIVHLCPLQHNLHPHSARAQMMLLGPQTICPPKVI